jgi:hypothetical protein
VVIYDTKEYIWTGSVWKELGDQSRIGALESKLDALDYNNTTDSGAHKFVTNVTQTDGKIAATFAQPTSADIVHDNTTVDGALDAHNGRIQTVEDKLIGVTNTVTASITEAINGLNANDPTASGEATSFIATAKQVNGKLEVTKATVPTASTSKAGIVKLNATGGAAKYDDFVTLKDTTVAGINTRVENVESNYVKYNSSDKKLYIGKDGTDVIIFDCGGATAL